MLRYRRAKNENDDAVTRILFLTSGESKTLAILKTTSSTLSLVQEKKKIPAFAFNCKQVDNQHTQDQRTWYSTLGVLV